MSSLKTSGSTLYNQLPDLVAFRFHVKQKKLAHQTALMANPSGSHSAVRKGRGMTFSEVRQYQAGDDIRHIDWRVTARTQKTHTKVFIEEHERPTILVTEQTPALFFGSQVRLKINQVMNLSAILAWTALGQNERVGSLSFNQTHQAWVAPKRNPQTVLQGFHQALQLQSTLHHPGESSPQVWQARLQHLIKVVKPGSKLFLVGDLLQLNPACWGYLQTLRRHNDVVALHVFDPIEKTLPSLGWLSLAQNVHSNHRVNLDSTRQATRQRYADAYQQQWKTAQTQSIKLKIPLFEIGCHEDPLQSLIRHKLIVTA